MRALFLRYDARKPALYGKITPLRASCDHGFASYVSRFIIYALFGFDVLYPEKGGAKNGIKLNSEAVLPFKQKTVNLSVLNNIVTVK